jgi:hypothetical protein
MVHESEGIIERTTLWQHGMAALLEDRLTQASLLDPIFAMLVVGLHGLRG